MSIRTKDSLNCPCNGIYKCGFHSPPTKFVLRMTDDNHKELMKIIERMEVGTPPHFISPCITKPFPEIVDDWWRPQHLAFLDSKEYD